ncbi:uncharacterized protein LOC107038634 [Diachasma alloeum]|uniref:uncharacterized protein LOC107038634 n=1 Tax=Diachasma alloeum TaxID=454923 RepID=UPI0007384138|nr:uncharacterized protein LOC107038634 [Diachasma alloeum]
MFCLSITKINQSWRVRLREGISLVIKRRKNYRIMTFGLENLGLVAWIFVIIIFLICCSAFFMCCIESEEDFMTSSGNRDLQKPYDPRADGVVDMGPMLFLNHFYNSTYNGNHETYDLSGGTDIGDAGGDGDCGGDGGCD